MAAQESRRYRLTCLICGERNDSLVGLQEHAMFEHGYAQADHRGASRRIDPDGSFVWTFPDGVEWMRAVPTDARAAAYGLKAAHTRAAQ